ncbi:MAG: peptidoglycan editing factor PgeF [Caulobacteraceae bacterium]|nr:peptidoglycan editing factor PgeF [Caulobacteraceae bacterium]
MAELPVLRSALLADLPGVRHAFFSRKGGVSKGIYEGLNVGRGSKDDPRDVAENRRRAAAHFGAEPGALLTCHQIHSTVVTTADAPWGDARPEADGVATTTPGLVCGALAADCAPILYADAEARVVAAVHSGWRGALGGVPGAAVETMIGLGAERSRIVAVVGPCIGPASYEVGLEFLDRFEAEAPGSARFFRPGAAKDKRLFDLPAFVLHRLAEAGVARAEWIGADTCADEDFFSNRRAFKRGEGDYGRLLSAIALA